MHETTKIRHLRLQVKVKVVRHAAVRKDLNPKLLGEPAEFLDELLVVPIIVKDNCTLVPTIDDVVTRIRIFNSERTSHTQTISLEAIRSK